MSEVIDMTRTIIPKSDQRNADDLIGRSMVITITKVTLGVSPEQPVSIHYEGDEGRVWKPCKSMRRVLVIVWGNDGQKYVGKKLTLFRDGDVQWAGQPVGGIRISHMSGITSPMTMHLTATRGNKKPYTVRPLVDDTPPATVQHPPQAAPRSTQPSAAFVEFDNILSEAKYLADIDEWKELLKKRKEAGELKLATGEGKQLMDRMEFIQKMLAAPKQGSLTGEPAELPD